MANQDQYTGEKAQLLQNLYGMIGEVNAAAFHAAKFAKKALDGADPNAVRMDGPKAKVVEIGLAALRASTEAAVAINNLSEKAVALSQEIQGTRQLNE